jgi:hypothetical protein
MRKIAVGAAIVSAMVAAVIGAGSAHATIAVIGSEGDMNPYNYRDELRYAGLLHEDVNNAASLGPMVCRQRAMGYSGDQIMRLLDPSSSYYTAEQDVVIVGNAEFHFCPVYEHDRVASPPPPPALPSPLVPTYPAPLAPPPIPSPAPPVAPYPDPGQTV